MEFEKIGAFTQRLQTEFPQAQILMINTPPDESIRNDPGQFIQISKVKPLPAEPIFQQSNHPIPDKIARFYYVNDVTHFQHDRPVYKGQVDKDNEFKSLWIERTILNISQPLPGILRWFEVINQIPLEVTPVEFACETMENVRKELIDLIAQYRCEPKKNINPFSMRLQGIIDANVMGGISKYQEAFFSEQFANSDEGKGQQINVHRLKTLMYEQIQILDRALDLHGSLAPEGVQPLHNRLLERFTQMKKNQVGLDRIRRQPSESIVNTPLPPLPTDKRVSNSSGIQYEERLRLKLNGDSNASERNSNYHQLNYEQDTVYTRPSGNGIVSPHSYQRCQSNAENGGQPNAPPVPLRPKSAGFSDAPEVPPKLSVKEARSMPMNVENDSSAPPLPPRGMTFDKRNSNSLSHFSFGSSGSGISQNDLQATNFARRIMIPKYDVVNISLSDEPEADANIDHLSYKTDSFGYEEPPPEFRDSGVSSIMSIRSNGINECVNMHASKENSVENTFDANSNEDADDYSQLPPPIPKKTLGSLGHGLNHTHFDEHIDNENDISPDGYCIPKGESCNQ